MLARVVQANMEISLKLVAALFAQSKTADELAEALVSALRSIIDGDPDFFNLFFESWAMARQSPLIGRELKALYGQFREAIQEGLEEATAKGTIAPEIPLDGLAVLLTGIIDGLGLQLVTEPELAANETIWNATEAGIRVLLGGTHNRLK